MDAPQGVLAVIDGQLATEPHRQYIILGAGEEQVKGWSLRQVLTGGDTQVSTWVRHMVRKRPHS